MRPDNNQELFRLTSAKTEREIAEESNRRESIGPILADLSQLFDAKIHTLQPVAEPTVVTKLFALGLVQRSHLGVIGFHPLEYVGSDGMDQHELQAKAAPHHDSYESDGRTFRTRAISLSLPESSRASDDIEFYGLNLYVADFRSQLEPADEKTTSKLLLVNREGNVAERRNAISGRTNLFAVRNKLTDDCKIYYVEVDAEPEDDQFYKRVNGAEFKDYDTAICRIPNGLNYMVKQLTGIQQDQAAAEFDAAGEQLRNAADPNVSLNAQAARAAKDIAFNAPALPDLSNFRLR